ncbi:MAG: chaperone modulator CbpM [Thiobacillus sp.]|nr:chaperone modulator CbpM [Thiobacillus sp.]
MSTTEIQSLHGLIVEEDMPLTLEDLCQACCASREHVVAWVVEGVLEPIGDTADWRFTGASLHRARLALSLTLDLEINLPGVALALDLFDEIAALQAHQQRVGPR